MELIGRMDRKVGIRRMGLIGRLDRKDGINRKDI